MNPPQVQLLGYSGGLNGQCSESSQKVINNMCYGAVTSYMPFNYQANRVILKGSLMILKE